MRRSLIGLVVSLSAACMDGVTGASTVTGAYTLRTVNGSPLPYTLSTSGTVTTEIVDGVITLYQGGTYAETTRLRVTTNGQSAIETKNGSGSFGLQGTSITLRSSDGATQRLANIKDAETMTFVEAGMTRVFTK
jgi:hypothetical protein